MTRAVSAPLSILYLESQSDYAELVSRELDRAGIQAKILRVSCERDYASILQKEQIDLILADDGALGCGGRMHCGTEYDVNRTFHSFFSLALSTTLPLDG